MRSKNHMLCNFDFQIVAHEIGHNLGMHHNEKNSGCTGPMNSSVGWNTPSTWSTCSKKGFIGKTNY